jgi:transposase
MRGTAKSEPEFLALFSPNQAVPKNHPLRNIKPIVDQLLSNLSPLLDEMYAAEGRPSIPPERLLKAQLLIALYSVRSRNLFAEQLHYNLLFRWFLDMDLTEPGFDDSSFSKNQDRLLQHAVADQFFHEVVAHAHLQQYVSDDHFTVDGTLIEAWASLKSFKRQGSADQPPGPGGDPGNPTVDFHGEKRCNQTHQSTTDPQARLYKKGKGKEAKLCFGAHVLMENRQGLCVDFRVESATEVTETQAALVMLGEQKEIFGVQPHTVGADKGYHNREFVQGCREKGIIPHVAQQKNRQLPGLDGRTSATPEYAVSQKVRKRVEEIFGWIKTVGGFRKSRVLGIQRTQMEGYWVAAAYNLVRLGRLASGP